MKTWAVLLIALLACAGCNGGGPDASFRSSYERSFAQSCIQRAAELGAKGPAICGCASKEMALQFNSYELVALTLGVGGTLRQRYYAAIQGCINRAMTEAGAYRRSTGVYRPAGTICLHEAYVMKPVQPEFPSSARYLTTPVTTQVVVSIAPSGILTDARVYRSSGIPAIDSAAIKAARASTYAPKMIACRPVASRYLFRADFAP